MRNRLTTLGRIKRLPATIKVLLVGAFSITTYFVARDPQHVLNVVNDIIHPPEQIEPANLNTEAEERPSEPLVLTIENIEANKARNAGKIEMNLISAIEALVHGTKELALMRSSLSEADRATFAQEINLIGEDLDRIVRPAYTVIGYQTNLPSMEIKEWLGLIPFPQTEPEPDPEQMEELRYQYYLQAVAKERAGLINRDVGNNRELLLQTAIAALNEIDTKLGSVALRFGFDKKSFQPYLNISDLLISHFEQQAAIEPQSPPMAR